MERFVRIPIEGGGTSREATIIELQGSLLSSTGEYAGQPIGDLEVRDGTPFLTIGIHQLEGKFVDLAKPIAVMQREDRRFVVEYLVRRKILFKNRPKLLVQPKPSTGTTLRFADDLQMDPTASILH